MSQKKKKSKKKKSKTKKSKKKNSSSRPLEFEAWVSDHVKDKVS